jgi:hypothetical protein
VPFPQYGKKQEILYLTLYVWASLLFSARRIKTTACNARNQAFANGKLAVRDKSANGALSTNRI